MSANECEHEWEVSLDGTHEICAACGDMREYDGAVDDGRDFTEPYEP